jgi:hypothetical protein
MAKQTFKHGPPAGGVTPAVVARSERKKTTRKSGLEAQLHVLMPKADIVALKRAALDRGTTVSDLVRESVQVYIGTK